jgi:crotonobetainyl-CoA:carnitine CoA-transferase CaiB-like acyl-CoA transferase
MVQKGADGVENLGTPILFRNEPGRPSLECATQGQHTDRILERLGYDAAARAKLKAAKVC